MKLINKVSLRLRLTILTTLILTIICILLTLSLIFAGLVVFKNIEPVKIDSEIFIAKNEMNIQFIYISIISMLIMITVGSSASYFIAGKALKPVNDLSKWIESIDEDKIYQPLEGFNSDDEVSRLAASFNNMLSKLEKSFKQQKQFAANAAHELRTPLAGIITNIEVLQLDDNPTVQEYREVIDEILINAQRMSTLVYDLLKINSVLNLNNCISFDAKEMFDDIVLELCEYCKEKKLCIENNVSGVLLFGEKVLLQRAFFNLVQNALKYNKTGGKAVISAEQSNNFITIIISDTGIGIPKEELQNIFEPFYRVDISRSREFGGSGLGLSIVKAIIEKHNGKISIESEIGVSTKITVIMPKKLTVI